MVYVENKTFSKPFFHKINLNQCILTFDQQYIDDGIDCFRYVSFSYLGLLKIEYCTEAAPRGRVMLQVNLLADRVLQNNCLREV